MSDGEEEDNVTKSASIRWEYLGTIMTAMVYFTALGVWAYGTVVRPGLALPDNLVTAVVTAFMLHVAWVVGPKAIESYKNLKG